MKKKNGYVGMGRRGHLMVPRGLLNEIFGAQESPVSEPLAFLCMLTKMNYSDRTVRGKLLERGASMLTLNEWSALFGWSRRNTGRFFELLEAEGVIVIDRKCRPHRLRIVDYEELCANRKACDKSDGEGEKSLTKAERMFEEFWTCYHDVTAQTPMEKYAAQREWKRMNLRERTMALENIEQYYMCLPDVRHVRKAYNYLRDKSYLID